MRAKREREEGPGTKEKTGCKERREEQGGGVLLGTLPQEAGRGGSLSTHRYMMLCRIEAKGVMPMPAPMSTACSEAKILRVGVP